MVTTQQAKRLDYEPAQLTDADLSPGQDEGDTIAADSVAELFAVEVGGDSAGTLKDALAAVVGVPGEDFKETTKSKMTMDIQNSTPADVPQNTYFRLAVRSSKERGGTAITSWFLEDDYSEVNKVNREDLEPQEPGAREKKYLTVQAYNPDTSFSGVLANSTVQIPIQVGDD